MSKVIKIAFLFCLLCSGSVLIRAQAPKEIGLESISERAARAHIGFLAHDELQGREAGHAGGRIAAAYIQSYLKELGLQPFLGTGYAQAFKAYRVHFQTKGRWTIDPTAGNGKSEEPHHCLPMQNILAVLPGMTDELVIVGAHYDHLGQQVGLVKDSIYNGADDNASGVSAVLQLAKAFVESGVQPLRTLVFAFWDGEEKGLLGSTYFVQNYSRIHTVKSYLNFDMIGRNNKPEEPQHVVYFYTQKYPLFEEWLKSTISTYQLSLKPEIKAWDKPTSGSDNAPFALHDIPIIWYHTDGHPDYHQPTDEVDLLNWSKIVAITQSAYLNTWMLVNEEY